MKETQEADRNPLKKQETDGHTQGIVHTDTNTKETLKMDRDPKKTVSAHREPQDTILPRLTVPTVHSSRQWTVTPRTQTDSHRTDVGRVSSVADWGDGSPDTENGDTKHSQHDSIVRFQRNGVKKAKEENGVKMYKYTKIKKPKLNGTEGNNALERLLVIAGDDWDTEPVDDSFLCPHANGLFPDPGQCQFYHRCVHNVSTRLECDPGLIWSQRARTCDWGSRLECSHTKPSTILYTK